ncbi:PepSY domain-containing protein [Stenotrophomonas pigmentata]|uniref:PepSY domain-containing protein n=1 Tax=Stenotrophomonas pigmentata TaxID=3055080 RepID=UPI0026ECDEAC|nr:PepSY domain-containing protein [Stenotrophomonas sp. 610A2]
MNNRPLRTALIAAALTLAGSGIAQAQDALTAPQVRAHLESQGYTDIKDVKFEDGMWEADATSADGKKVDVKLDPRNGTVYPDKAVSQLGEADIRAQLSSAGYTGVSDVKLDDGMWKAKGRTAGGEKVEVRLDPATGAVVAQEKE